MRKLREKLYDQNEVLDGIIADFLKEGKRILNLRHEDMHPSSRAISPVQFHHDFRSIDIEALNGSANVDLVIIEDLREFNKIYGRAERRMQIHGRIVGVEKSLEARAENYLIHHYNPRKHMYLLNCRKEEADVELLAEWNSINKHVLTPPEKVLPKPDKMPNHFIRDTKLPRSYDAFVDRMSYLCQFKMYMEQLGVEIDDLREIDFHEHGMGDLLKRFYGGDVKKAVEEIVNHKAERAKQHADYITRRLAAEKSSPGMKELTRQRAEYMKRYVKRYRTYGGNMLRDPSTRRN